MTSGDTASDPGLKSKYCKSSSVSNWNLNSIDCHNFIEVSLITPEDAIYNFDVRFFSEKYFNSFTPLNKTTIQCKTRRGIAVVLWESSTAWKVPKYGVSVWSVFSCIQSKYRKKPTRENSVFGYFSGSVNIIIDTVLVILFYDSDNVPAEW